MGLDDFWLQSNNGKKYSLKNLKDIKPEDIAKNPKLQKFIKLFDLDGSGNIEIKNKDGQNEWKSIFTELQQAAVDNDLTSEEFGLYISQKSRNADLRLDDVNELLDAATQPTEEVAQANEQSIIDLLTELGVVQQTITDAELDKIKSDAYNTVLTSATKAEELDKDYEDLHSFAKEKLSKSGKQPTLQEIVLYAAELQLLNPDIKADKNIKKGTSINLPVKSLDKKKLQLLETKGIKVEKNNYIFFQKLLELDDAKQAVVLNAINNSKFKTKEEVINDVYNKTRINLADTGLTIKVGGISSTLENFITKTLKVDLSSKEGLKIYDRLSHLNQAVLDSLPKEFVAKLSKMNNITFDKLADKAEVFGIILRTDEEMKEREKNSQAYRDLKARMFMAQYVADNYTSAVTISQSADRNLNFTQGAWWIRNARPIGYTSNEQQKRDTAKVAQIKKLLLDADTLSNEEFAKRMSNIMEAKRTVSVSALPGDLPVSHEAKDPSFKFDPKLAYTFMKQMQRAELAAEAAKRLKPQRKQHVERNPYVQQSDNTRVYNAQREVMGIEYIVQPLDKNELEQLKKYIKSIKTRKELFLFAKSLHYKTNVMDNKVETMIPKGNQAEIAKLLEQKAKELGFAESTAPNHISLNTFRDIFTKPIDKKVKYPKTNDKTIMETHEAIKTKLLGTWDPVGEQIRTQEMEGTVGGVLDIATMILVTKGMGSMGAFVKIGNVGRNIGTATNIFKTANVASRFTKNASLINRLAKADKVLGGLWVNGAAGALHGAATMGAYGGLQGTVGMADNTIKNLLEGKDWSEGLGERFEQTLVMGYENAKFGLFAGYSGVLAQALGKGTVALGSKGIDKLFKTNYSKTVLDKVSSVVTEEGISGSEFFTKMKAASKAEGLVGFGYETGFFTLYHKMEEAGVDFNNEESLLTYIQNNLDEETKQSLGATYLSEGGNLAMFKIIGSLIQWVHIGKLSSGAAIEIQAKNNRALRNMNMRKVAENGKESYLVKFNENDKPIKVAPEQLMQLCEHKMFYSDVEDKAQKDGSFKLPNNQTVEYDKAKKVYRTVIDENNTVESTSVEDLLNQVNKIRFRNQINEQIFKDGQPVSAKSLLKLVMTQNGEPIKINDVEIKPEEVLENSETLDNVKIERTKVNGKEVYTITLADGKTIQETTVEGFMNTCESFFQLELLKSVLEKGRNPGVNEASKPDEKTAPIDGKTKNNILQFTTSTISDVALSQSRLNLTQFGKSGIPLKYSRENFIKELDALLSSLPPTERAKIEAKFGIKIENTTFNQLGKEIVGIPIIPDKLNGTKSEQAVVELIRKFTVENEVQIADTATKELLESILHTFPEFAMTIGKKQHDTHSFSVDIHTLRNLQDNLANPKYAELDAESQLVLKYATILHDIGKRFLGDRQSDHGHAALSTEYATKILERFDLSEEVKARIIKQVKNHHWFEEYNKGNQTPELVAKVVETFGTKEDFTIAEIMAKSDYMNVNDRFHLSRARSRVKGDGLMSETEFENFMTSSFEKIESQFNQGSGKINPNNTASNGQPRQKTAVDILSSKVENAQSRDEIVSLKQHIEELTDTTAKAVLMDKYFETLQKFVSEKEADLIKKITNNPELKENPVVLELLDKVLQREKDIIGGVPDNFFGWLLWKTDLTEVFSKVQAKQYMKKEELRASDLIDVLNIFIDNPVLYQNQKICELMADKAGYSFYAPEHSKFVKEGLELYVKTKELQENPIMQEYLEILFKDIDADKKLKLFNFINDHPNLFKPSIESFIQYSTNTDDFDTILDLWGKNKNGSLGEEFRCIGSSEKDYKINNVRLYFLKKYGDISVANITDDTYKFFMQLSESNISADFLKKYIDVLNENNLQSIQKLDKTGKFSSEDILHIACNITKLNKEFIEELCTQEDLTSQVISGIASGTARQKSALKLAKELCNIPDLPKDYISQVLPYAQKQRIPLIIEFCKDKDIREATQNCFGSIISYANKTNKDLIKKICKDKILDTRDINFIAARSRDEKDHNLIKKMYESKDIDKKYLKALIEAIRDENIEYLEKIYFNKDIPKELLAKINLSLCYLGENNAQYAEHLLLNYKKFGIYEEQIGTLIERSFVNSNEAYDLNVISKLNQQLGKENVLKLSNIELVVCMNNINLIGKKSLNDLSKTEKRNLLNTLLVNKNNIESNYLANLKDIIPILPQSTEEYVRNIDLIKNGLHMNGSDRLSVNAQKAFSKSLEDLSTLLKTSKGISDIRLSHSQNEFVEKINSILKDLPTEEQLKFQELFGFKIVNGKLTGYPNVNISVENYINKELFNKIKQEVEAYLDNQVIIENNPQLSNILNSIIKDCPELLNQIDESGDFTKVLQQLQITLSKKEFKDLSNDDKQIVILAHLFGNTDKHLNTRVDAACEGYFISQKLGLSKEMSQKLYAIIEMLNAPDEFMATSKKTTIRDYRGTILEGQERQDVFDLLAFKLKESNLFNLTKLVYDSKYPEGFTDRFNNLLSSRIREIKANDFCLLQTAHSTYRRLAQRTDVLNNNKVYSVYVVNAKDIPNFYALAHTPEAGFASGGTRDANFANFKLFEMVGDDKVICTGYITAEKAGLVKSFHHGFIFEVPNDKQYVGYGTDIFSLGKTIPDMVVEYFRDRGYEANRNRGDKWSHRTFISKALKRELYGIVGSKLKGVDDKYIARLDNIKEKLGSRPLTLENLRQIDPEFAKAYVRAINSKGWGIFYKKLLKEFEHNEVLVSNPKISAIFTDNIDNIPEEYLIKAQEENLPIVVIK